jgi:hypothetical protein
MNALRLPCALLICLLLSGLLLLAPDTAEADCCNCDYPCKKTCTCCYGCNSASGSKELLAAANYDTLADTEFGRSSLSIIVAKLDFTNGWEQLMRGKQCLRGKVISRLLAVAQGSPNLESAGLFDGRGMLK